MFEQSILPGGNSRAWFATAALLGQAAVYSLSAFIPLAYVAELPRVRRAGALVAPPETRPASSRKIAGAEPAPKLARVAREFVAPAAIPKHAATVADSEPPPGIVMTNGDSHELAGIPGLDETELPPPPPPPVPAAEAAPPERPAPERIVVGGKVQSAQLIHRVAPEYPPLARLAQVQGAVELRAVIGKDGRIAELRIVSGNPMLAPAAMKAVKQWRYTPTLLNGKPIEVETSIKVIFSLRRPQ